MRSRYEFERDKIEDFEMLRIKSVLVKLELSTSAFRLNLKLRIVCAYSLFF